MEHTCIVYDTISHSIVLSNSHRQNLAWKVVIFQLLYTFAALQRLLPGFRHNDINWRSVRMRYDLLGRFSSCNMSAMFVWLSPVPPLLPKASATHCL